MADQTPDCRTDLGLRQVTAEPHVCTVPTHQPMTDELREHRARIAELAELHEAASERTGYESLFRSIRAGIEHVIDYRDQWRSLTRDQLIDQLMTMHTAGLGPRISEAVVGLASAVARDIQRERNILRARLAELDAMEAELGEPATPEAAAQKAH
ncbi:hypothetical protein IU436_27420 [Nocardia farcinica]|uniref:hypothetical protein n=1 Tax=Nocardia TaxID=1817 RepID=UPI00189555EC|nr:MULTISPECIES: hypothetical protein [Nocardia]MBF6215658.1 hypothetical protein [Nocardia puris]MBF6422371.1 hypothetical protein [Nocardia farcinica]MBF6434072.1 hypothetical protein [Nocardia farcinica]MBF6505128.1 hypothetical protein [Nocardia farcinica]